MQQYPNGMESVSPTPVSDPGKEPKRRGTSFSVGDSSSKTSSDEAVRQEMQRRSDLILKDAETNPARPLRKPQPSRSR